MIMRNPIIRQKMGIPVVAFCYDTLSPAAGDFFLSYADLNVVLDSSSYLVTSSQPDKYLYLWTPQDSRIYYNPSLERDIDVSFVGTVQIENDKDRYSDRRKGIDALRKAGIEVYQAGGQRSDLRLSVEEYARVFMRSKISLNFPRTGLPEMGVFQLKGRVFEATLCGSLLLEEEENPETAKWFEPNVDYVTYKDETDLVEKVKYYLEHDDERIEIARRSYEKAKSKYTEFAFWQAIFERLGIKVEDNLAFENKLPENQTSQAPEKQQQEANSSSQQLEVSLRWNSISELFSQILHQTDLLNIKRHHTPENHCIALESLLRKVAKKQMKVLEIGSWKGMATAVMGGVLSEYEGTLFAIDTWKGSSSVPSMEREARGTNIFNVFIQNMKMLGLLNQIVQPIGMESIAAAQIFQDNSFDFIFIDGDHSYSSIKQDILAWLPTLKEGGTICGHCAEGYYSQYSEKVKAEIDRQCEVDYIKTEEGGVHPGVVKAVYEVFGHQYEIMPGTYLWHYQKKAIDSQGSVGASKPNKLNPYYAAHVKILLNILGENTKEEPGQGSIYQNERICLVAQYCIQGWNGDLIQLGFSGIEVTKKLAELAKKSNRRLVIVLLAEAETKEVSSNLEETLLKEIEPYTDVVSIIKSGSLTDETIELIKNQEFCFAFIEGLETYDTCLTAIKTFTGCSGIIAVDNVLESQEISRAFLQGSEFTNRSKLYLPLCREGYLLWS
ncbi:MAG: glycosyltransferase [Okeania sp. SIO3C4]|nr:glycosyltransferase [Okeania sp. SIO3C4]